MDKNISFTLKVWRQKGPKAKGAFETYQMKDIPGDTSFLEMLDLTSNLIYLFKINIGRKNALLMLLGLQDHISKWIDNHRMP